MPSDLQPRGMSTGATAQWLAARGMNVGETTVRHWCRVGRWRDVALRTAGGHYRVPRAALVALFEENDLLALAA